MKRFRSMRLVRSRRAGPGPRLKCVKVESIARDNTGRMPRRLSLVVAAIPVLALTFGVPLVNRDDPHVLGLPFVLAWIVVWIAVLPAFLWFIPTKLERRR